MVSRGMRIRTIAVLAGLLVTLSVPAFAQGSSIDATAPYELDFTLPTESMSGCQVCHGDPALIRIRDGLVQSYFIDEKTYRASSHGTEQCVGCHVDFTYRAPHTNKDWTIVAKSSCKNCHEDQQAAFGRGVHRATTPTTTAGPVAAEAPASAAAAALAIASAETSEIPKPLCGDCHGSHEISMLTTDTPEAKAARKAVHADGYEVCGRCHQDYWDNYDDYYHGAAYKRGAADAPACWDCHGWHEILPSDDRGSLVNPAHLVDTCSGLNLPKGDGRRCHAVGVDENYIGYAEFIHGREEITAANPVVSWYRSITGALGALFD